MQFQKTNSIIDFSSVNKINVLLAALLFLNVDNMYNDMLHLWYTSEQRYRYSLKAIIFLFNNKNQEFVIQLV